MSTVGLDAPGRSTYISDTMYVGDGTWDAERNTFLLPNIMGLNFETMRYNGMGNRFRDVARYHSLILGHGIIAAITFLIIVPAAIMVARFYHRNPRMALRFHIWLQILTIGLTTVAFVLGWIAVGERRSLTNPHHGIGLAIYVLVLVQAIGGGLIHHSEKGKERYIRPMKLILHQWFGRAISALGIAQIPIGLTLYGSPKALFILYAVWTFAGFLIYFFLSYINQSPVSYDSGTSYVSSSRVETIDDRHVPSDNGRLRTMMGIRAPASGPSTVRDRSPGRARDRNKKPDNSILHDGSHSRHASGSSIDEKYKDVLHDETGRRWKNPFSKIAEAFRPIFGGKNTTSYSDMESYVNPTSSTHEGTQNNLSRVEEGRAPASPHNDRWRQRRERAESHKIAARESRSRSLPKRSIHHRRSDESINYSERRVDHINERDQRRNSSRREGVSGFGFAGFFRNAINRGQKKNEGRQFEKTRLHDKEYGRTTQAKRNRHRFTGDGARRTSYRRQESVTSCSLITGSNPELSLNTRPPHETRPSASTDQHINYDRQQTEHSDASRTSRRLEMPMASTDTHHINQEVSKIEDYQSAEESGHYNHHTGHKIAPASTTQDDVVAGQSSMQQRDPDNHSNSMDNVISSPPVSVKVKLHEDGRQVTLRRLNQQEAAAEREARKREKSRRRPPSLSSASNFGEDRWRRTKVKELDRIQGESSQAPGSASASTNVNLNQRAAADETPIPVYSNAMASISHVPSQSQSQMPTSASAMGGSFSSPPGTNACDTGTDMTNYDSNRRRRRAERGAFVKGNENRVEFS